jgi:hypothetical protein
VQETNGGTNLMFAQSIKLTKEGLAIISYSGETIVLSSGMFDEAINLMTQNGEVSQYLTECGVPTEQAGQPYDFLGRVCYLTGMYTAEVGVFDPEKKMFVVPKGDNNGR